MNRGWHIRRPTNADIEAALTLMRTYDTAVSGEPDTDLEDLKHEWSQIQLDQDAWLVTSDRQELIGYAAILPHQVQSLRIHICTSPDMIETSLPNHLLNHCMERANVIDDVSDEDGIHRLFVYILHSNLHFRKLFEQFGFTSQRNIFQMSIDLLSAPPEPQWPAGISARAFKPGKDDLKTYELVQDAFERPGRVRSSFEKWKSHMLRPCSFNPDLWTLAFDGEKMVGVCLGFEYPQEGWVRQLGVDAGCRGLGLGSALLRNAFTNFYARGKLRVGLTVESDNPDALTFYQRIGMTIKRQIGEYVKPYPKPAGDADSS